MICSIWYASYDMHYTICKANNILWYICSKNHIQKSKTVSVEWQRLLMIWDDIFRRLYLNHFLLPYQKLTISWRKPFDGHGLIYKQCFLADSQLIIHFKAHQMECWMYILKICQMVLHFSQPHSSWSQFSFTYCNSFTVFQINIINRILYFLLEFLIIWYI